MMRKFKVANAVMCFVLICFLIATFYIPAVGDLVICEEAINAGILLFVSLLAGIHILANQKGIVKYKKITPFVVSVVIFGLVGSYNALQVLSDVEAGPRDVSLNMCISYNRQGIYGIISQHYFTEGIDEAGNVQSYEIDKATFYYIKDKPGYSIEFKGYDNTKRIEKIYKIEPMDYWKGKDGE